MIYSKIAEDSEFLNPENYESSEILQGSEIRNSV